jgi:hypothetical protein
MGKKSGGGSNSKQAKGGGSKGSGGGGGSFQQIKDRLQNVGPKLSSSELDRIKEKTGVSGGIRAIAKKQGISLPGSGPRERAEVPGYGSSEAQGMFPAVLDYNALIGSINAQGNIDTQIANLNSDASKYITQLQVGGAKDVANIQSGTAKYVADRELESNLGVENIRTKGAIDLQGIINAGLANVENIRGEYGIKGKKVDRSTAILGGLVSAFSF